LNKWVTKDLLKVSFFSTTSTSVPLALLGLNVPQALILGTGISLSVSAILYNRERAKILRENPYSYLLSAERTFQQENDPFDFDRKNRELE
jgi:hypothetical protein